MEIKTFLRNSKPKELNIKLSGGMELVIFKHPDKNKYSAKISVLSEHNYYTDRFDYIKYYNFDYLKKKLIKEYGHLTIKEVLND